MFAVAIKFIKRTQTTSAVARSTTIPVRRCVVQEQASSLLKEAVLSNFESFGSFIFQKGFVCFR
jgi:hypothetical protein